MGTTSPKCLSKINGKYLIDRVLKPYRDLGFESITLLTGYGHEEIVKAFPEYDINGDYLCNPEIMFTGIPEKKSCTAQALRLALQEELRKINYDDMVDEEVSFTYGDSILDIRVDDILHFHKSHGKILTMTVARPKEKFGIVEISHSNSVMSFKEKPKSQNWINAGFFIADRDRLLRYLTETAFSFEEDVLPLLIEKNEVMAFKHDFYYQQVDTLKDVEEANKFFELVDQHTKIGMDRLNERLEKLRKETCSN